MNESLPTILLVEDDPADLELTLRAFRKHDVSNPIAVARDGVEAMDYLHRRGRLAADAPIPALILLDIGLPRMSGLEVLREVRAHPVYRTVPVVILTTSQDVSDIRTSYELGANSYIAKSVEFDTFLDMIGRIHQYWLLTNIAPPTAQSDQGQGRHKEGVD